MANVDKSVFVSYRRPNMLRALAISQKLSAHGYDVYFDHGDSSNGEAEQTNLDQIKARPHFLVILTSTSLDPCDDPNDPMRRELEAALDGKHNIICLMYDGANIQQPLLAIHLVGALAGLLRYPILTVSKEHFDETIKILYGKYLSALLHPAWSEHLPKVIQTEAERKDYLNASAGDATMTAQKWFEQGDKSSDWDEKIRCYTEAIRLQADFADVYVNRALARQYKGDNDGAIQDITRATELEPQSAVGYNNRGELLSSIGDLENAIRDFNEAIRRQPDFAFAYNNRGDARRDKGDLDGAIQDFTRAIELDPEFALYYSNRGMAFHIKGNLRAGFDDCNEAIRLKPDLAGAYNNRGTIRKDMGDIEGAIHDFTKAIQLDKNVAPYYYNRGLAYHQKGDLYQAAVNYIEAIRLEPDYYGAYNNRAAIRFVTGDLVGAISDYDKVLHINPGYIMAYKDRARAYLAKKDYSSAKVDLQRYIDLGGTPSGEQNELERLLSSLIPGG